jgi:hypothetical protein
MVFEVLKAICSQSSLLGFDAVSSEREVSMFRRKLLSPSSEYKSKFSGSNVTDIGEYGDRGCERTNDLEWVCYVRVETKGEKILEA